MIEVIVKFSDYTITYQATESALFAQARLSAWVTRYPAAQLQDKIERRYVKHEHGETLRAILKVTVTIREPIPDDLRSANPHDYW